jgi:integrase
VDAAFGLDHAQASMGHSSPQTTRRYTKRSLIKAAAVAKGMG